MIEKSKTLSKGYKGIILNENDLNRLAKILKTEAEKLNIKLNIKIRSSIRNETYTTDDPNIFFSQEIPNEISSVVISMRDYDSPISCEIEIGYSWLESYGVKLSVSGDEFILVTGLYNELDREISLRESPWKWLIVRFDTFLFTMFINLILIVSIYSFFDIIIRLLVKNDIFLWHSEIHYVLQYIGLFCIGVVSFAGAFVYSKFLIKIFPPIEFGGRFVGQNVKSKKILITIITFVIVPIIINIISTFVSNFLKI